LPFLDKFILSLLVAPIGEERMQQQQQLLLLADLSWFFKKAAAGACQLQLPLETTEKITYKIHQASQKPPNRSSQSRNTKQPKQS
jgi:hypothetical protein